MSVKNVSYTKSSEKSIVVQSVKNKHKPNCQVNNVPLYDPDTYTQKSLHFLRFMNFLYAFCAFNYLITRISVSWVLNASRILPTFHFALVHIHTQRIDTQNNPTPL